jgi:hypothetical protein
MNQMREGGRWPPWFVWILSLVQWKTCLCICCVLLILASDLEFVFGFFTCNAGPLWVLAFLLPPAVLFLLSTWDFPPPCLLNALVRFMSRVRVRLLCVPPVPTTELLLVSVRSPRLTVAFGLSSYRSCVTGAGLLSFHAYLDFSTAATSSIFQGSLDSSAREYRTVFVSRVHPLLRSWSGVLARAVQNLTIQGPSPLDFLLFVSGALCNTHFLQE